MAANTIPASLLKAYRASIPHKLDTLAALVRQSQSPVDVKSFEDLRMAVHKLAGSAGTYGFTEVSEICKTWEQFLINPPHIHNSAPHWALQNAHYLQQVHQYFK